MAKKRTKDAIARLQDAYGFPSRRSLERCAKYSRKLGYLLLGLQAFADASIMLLGFTFVFAFSIYTSWFFLWVILTLHDHAVLAPWSVALTTHGWIWLGLFVGTRFLDETVRMYERLLRYREQQVASAT